MLKRIALLLLSVWMFASGAAQAHTGPCGKDRFEVAAAVTAEHHCAMMADQAGAKPDDDGADPAGANCCCPAVLAIAAPLANPDMIAEVHARPGRMANAAPLHSFTRDIETPPPKA